MTTFFIIILFVAVAWLTLAVVSYNTQQSRKIEILEARLQRYKDAFNTSSARSNEHFRAFKELAGFLGYCVHEEHMVQANLASILNGEPMKHTKKLVVHKKEADPKPRKVAGKRKVATRRK